jgi:hypothetical protein
MEDNEAQRTQETIKTNQGGIPIEGLLDITSLVEECASSLTLAEPFLEAKETFHFSLHDSMAATQLMDKKMDCCEIPASHYSKEDGIEDKVVFPRPAPSSLDDPFHSLPWDDLTVRDAAVLGLEMLVRLQASLSGSSVGESTFTCLYAHARVLSDMRSKLYGEKSLSDPWQLPNENKETRYAQFIVFVFALALVDGTLATREIINNGDIWEEEDFSPNTHDIPFFTEREDVPMIKLLEQAMHMTKDQGKENPDYETIMWMVTFHFGFVSMCKALVS